MKLKSVNCSLLTPQDIIKLNLANIQTTEQLITHSDLDSLSRQTGIPFKQLKIIKKQIIGEYSPFPEPANIILEKYVKNLFIIETGSGQIDDLISNGFYSGEISEITGLSSTGKSQLCFQLISNMVTKHPNYTCLFIDSNKNFCHHRITQLIEQKFSKITINQEKKSNILKLIKTIDCSNVFNLIEILFKLAKPGSKTPESIDAPNLLIIDSLTPLFSIFRQNSFTEINYYLSYVSTQLKYLCNNHKMMVVVVSNLSNAFNLNNNPIWSNVPSLIVCLKNDLNEINQRENGRKFELIKCARPFFNDRMQDFVFFKIDKTGFI
ncbi:DNA repair RAD51 -like protein [Brachionus plicatilis]|uniref:DNA repair RAD51-like protein n=1 Tax=Brachionus plicatilis TaxID=10195 RepID=A0A3M7S937_BRAPC|nr:DNA repair RAD51 -like protein [Brachionus plicatilis]